MSEAFSRCSNSTFCADVDGEKEKDDECEASGRSVGGRACISSGDAVGCVSFTKEQKRKYERKTGRKKERKRKIFFNFFF